MRKLASLIFLCATSLVAQVQIGKGVQLGAISGGGAGNPAAPFSSCQFNNSGVFGGSSGCQIDTSGNVRALSLQGLQDAFLNQTTPSSNNGIHNALQSSGNYVLAGPNYANVEANVGSTVNDWRIPLFGPDAAFFFSQSPGYATNTLFEDQRYHGPGVSNKGYFIYDPLGYQTGIAPPAIYNRIYYDRQPNLSGHGITTVGIQNDLSRFGSGINLTGIPDGQAGYSWNFFNTARGISNPFNFFTQCMGVGDCHPIQNTLLYGGGCFIGSDECNTLYRNTVLDDFVVWTATSPSNQAAGTTQILGNYIATSGLAGDGLPLLDTTQISSQFLITATNGSPAVNEAGNLVTSGVTFTPDVIGRVLTSYDNTAIPPQYNGGTTTVSLTVSGLTSPLTTGIGCWADTQFIESLSITAVGSLSGGSQTATVHARYPHISFGGIQGSYFSQGPQACKYIEALANRKQGGANAPLRNWSRLIGAVNSNTLLFTATAAGQWVGWPFGAFDTFNLPTGTTLTRDGSGHSSLTITSLFSSNLNNARIRIHATDSSYNGDFQVTLTSPTPGTVILTWPNTGGAGTTTTTTPIYLLVGVSGLGLTEANAAVIFPGAEIVNTGNPSTHTMDGSNLVEANNLTVASGDQLEAQHGNELNGAIEHSQVGNWTATSPSLTPTAHFFELTGNLVDQYLWNDFVVSLDGGESQLQGHGGTRPASAVYTQISGDRIFNTFYKTHAPVGGGNLWFVDSCPVDSGTACNLLTPAWNILDIQNPHSSFQMSWQESNQIFEIANNALNFFDQDPSGFNLHGGDVSGNNFGAAFKATGNTIFFEDSSGDFSLIAENGTSLVNQVHIGANTSHCTQSATSFACDVPITGSGTAGVSTINSVAGAFTFTGSGVSCTSTTCTFSGTGSGVTSVAQTVPTSLLSITGSPITGAGTLALGLTNAAQNSVWAGPVSGGTGAPTYRALVIADLPSIAFSNITGQATNAQLATQTANTVLGAVTATTPSGLAVPSCSGASNALTWTSGTGFGCNTITGSGNTTSTSLTTNTIPKANGANSIINSGLTDDGTKLTYTGSGTANGLQMPEGTAITGLAASDNIWADSTAHRWAMNNNNAGALDFVGIATAGTAGHLAVLATNGIDIADGGAVPTQTFPSAGIMVSTGSAFGTSLTAPASTIVGISDTQTITNKSIAATQLTGTLQAAQEPAHTGDATNTAGNLALTIAANAVTSAKTAVVNTYRTCDIPIGDTSASALTNAQLGPQSRVCFIPAASTIVEMDVNADAGTPNIIVGRNHAGTIVNIVSAALATAATGGIACSKTSAVTGLNGATTCSATLQNTSLSAGDYLELVSGTAGGTAKFFVAHVIYTVN